MKIKALALLLASCIGSVAFADSPFDGTWQLNTAKSHLAGDTMSFADAGDGSLKYSDSDESYTFKPDGSTFTTPLGTERTFKKVSDSSYTTTNKRNGNLVSTSAWKLSADGSTLVIEAKGTKPNGDTFDNVVTYKRTAPGSGLVGGWKSTSIKLSSPNAITINSAGDDVTVTITALKVTCQAKWDSKDYPASGPTVAKGLTFALSKAGASGFKMVRKFNSKVLTTVRYKVSADGKTLTAHGVNGEGKEPFTEVFEKVG